MQFALLIYDDEASWANLSEEESKAIMDEWWSYTEELKKSGAYVAGEALQPVATAKSVRVRDGEQLVTDGPFAETKEQFGGFYVIDVETLDEALEWAARIPSARIGT